MKSELKSVTILSQYFYPEPGAAQIRLGMLAKELKKLGIRVNIITGMPNYPDGKIQREYQNKFFSREKWNGINIKRIWLYAASGRRPLARLANYLSFSIFVFFPLIFSRKTDLLFVESQPITLAIPAYLNKIFKGVPYIYNTPDLQIEHAEEAGWVKSKKIIKLAKIIEEFLMKKSLYVTVVTEAYINHFIEERNISKNQILFLPNGADTKKLYPSDYNSDYQKKMGIFDENKIIFTFAGTFAPYQGIETILFAAKELLEFNNIQFLLAGEGPEKQKLRELSKKLRINNLSFIDSPFDEMKDLMSITYASLVVLKDKPTANKQRLSKVIPPLACGVPVIFAGNGESAKLIIDNDCGLVIEPDRPKLLAKQIYILSKDKEKRDKLGGNGLKYVSNNLSWENVINNWYKNIKL